MARKDTNKQYSLRKLKTGTASVAVAVAVLGAGFANQTEVKAAEIKKPQADSAWNWPKEYNALLKENEELKVEREKYLSYADDKEKDPQYRALMGENQDLRKREGQYQDKIEELEKERKEKQERQEQLERQYQIEADKHYQEQQKKHQQEQQQLEAEKQRLLITTTIVKMVKPLSIKSTAHTCQGSCQEMLHLKRKNLTA